jgi:hypothetical protein
MRNFRVRASALPGNPFRGANAANGRSRLVKGGIHGPSAEFDKIRI